MQYINVFIVPNFWGDFYLFLGKSARLVCLFRYDKGIGQDRPIPLFIYPFLNLGA
jgi:hypothetical protein